MRARRFSPYSQIESLQRSRQELWTLVLLTTGLGIALNLLAGLISPDLVSWIPWPAGRYLLVIVLIIGLATVAIARFYATTESRRLQIEAQFPYLVAADGQPSMAEKKAYGVTILAHKALMHAYAQSSPEFETWLCRWRQAQADKVPFQEFIADDNAALVQCMVLYALHRYGVKSLGPQAEYGWRRSELPARQLTMNDLPPALATNRFLRADQQCDSWRLWWPQDVEMELLPDEAGGNLFPRWCFRHKHYGYVEICWSPHLIVAGSGSQPIMVLSQGLKLPKRTCLHIIGTRFEAQAHFRWAFWRGSHTFHDWTCNLLAFLEEALDWAYFLNIRTDQLVASLTDRIGFVPRDTSVFDKLLEIEARLGQLEASVEQDDRGAGDRRVQKAAEK